MDSDMFSTTIENRCIVLKTASDVARFSFIVQDSLSYLDLKGSENSRISNYFRSLGCSCRSRSFKYFVNTEEKCRLFFAPRRRLLYTLHLDLPKGREFSLKDNVPKSVHCRRCCRSPLIAKIAIDRGFYANNLSHFIQDALDVNVPKRDILKWIVKVPFRKVPLLSCIQIRTASKFIDLFYPVITDSALLKDFIKQFNIYNWMVVYERPEILEFLLYHAHLCGNIRLNQEFGFEFLSLCILSMNYLNIRPILNYISYSEPTSIDYDEYLSDLSLERPGLTEDVRERAEEWITAERICRMAQIIWIFTDIQSSPLVFGYHEAASEALRLIWSSIPGACVTLGELEDAFQAAFSEEELMNIHGFYVKAIGESHAYVEPRSLKHLCRTVLRRTFEKNNLWIPEAVSRTGLPKSLQAFLNLEKRFAI